MTNPESVRITKEQVARLERALAHLDSDIAENKLSPELARIRRKGLMSQIAALNDEIESAMPEPVPSTATSRRNSDTL